jgi:hypothetical protein
MLRQMCKCEGEVGPIGIFKRNRALGFGEGRATVRLYGIVESGEPTVAATIDWEGEAELAPHVVPAYFDKLLVNLSRMPAERAKLLERFNQVLKHALIAGEEEDGPLICFVPILDEAPGDAHVEVVAEVAFLYEKERLGAKTHFKPARAANETARELALWALWDWVVLVFDADPNVLDPIWDNLIYQLAYYEHHGPPGVSDVGKAPFFGATSGNRDRLAEEIGGFAGLTGEEFLTLPDKERQAIIRRHAKQKRSP